MKDKILFYGAGNHSKEIYDFMEKNLFDDKVEGFCDRDATNKSDYKGKKVYSFEEVKMMNIPFVITVSDKDLQKEIEQFLKNNSVRCFPNITEWAKGNVDDFVEWNRNWCAFFHVKGMDAYFEAADTERGLAPFWDENTTFNRMFKKLDLEKVVELACGRGRHVPKYYMQAGNITLVDILENNINFCKERFKEKNNISYYCNDGYSLKELQDSAYTSVFSYDAMVHFEMMDIYSYLQEIFRVLKPGGYALIHHSNNTSDYKLTFENAVHGRNYMSKDLFAYLAYRSGFHIIKQEVIDFVAPQLDCVSLIQKKL